MTLGMERAANLPLCGEVEIATAISGGGDLAAAAGVRHGENSHHRGTPYPDFQRRFA